MVITANIIYFFYWNYYNLVNTITELPFQGLELQLFVFISTKDFNRNISTIKRDFGRQGAKIDSALTSLTKEGFIIIDETKQKYCLTEEGESSVPTSHY